eukprot:2690773-Prymnesium_polylepis.1
MRAWTKFVHIDCAGLMNAFARDATSELTACATTEERSPLRSLNGRPPSRGTTHRSKLARSLSVYESSIFELLHQLATAWIAAGVAVCRKSLVT